MKLMTHRQTVEHRARARIRALRGETLKPVGEKRESPKHMAKVDMATMRYVGNSTEIACHGCGYHVCSCVRRDPAEGRAFFSPRAYNDYTEIHAHYTPHSKESADDALAAVNKVFNKAPVSTVDYATKPDETVWVVHTTPGMSQAQRAQRAELARQMGRASNSPVHVTQSGMRIFVDERLRDGAVYGLYGFDPAPKLPDE